MIHPHIGDMLIHTVIIQHKQCYTVLYLNWGIYELGTPFQYNSHLKLPLYAKFHDDTLTYRDMLIHTVTIQYFTVSCNNWGINEIRTPFQCIYHLKICLYTEFHGDTPSETDIVLNTVILQHLTALYSNWGIFMPSSHPSCICHVKIVFMLLAGFAAPIC